MNSDAHNIWPQILRNKNSQFSKQLHKPPQFFLCVTINKIAVNDKLKILKNAYQLDSRLHLSHSTPKVLLLAPPVAHPT